MTKFRNKSGQELEDYIDTLLSSHGYKYTAQAEVGKTLFNKKMVTDFLIELPSGKCLLEMKRQEVKGTAEEKILFTATSLLNVCKNTNMFPILCLYGAGWSTGCIIFMRDWCIGKPIAFKSAQSIKELIINHELEGYINGKQQSYSS